MLAKIINAIKVRNSLSTGESDTAITIHDSAFKAVYERFQEYKEYKARPDVQQCGTLYNEIHFFDPYAEELYEVCTRNPLKAQPALLDDIQRANLQQFQIGSEDYSSIFETTVFSEGAMRVGFMVASLYQEFKEHGVEITFDEAVNILDCSGLYGADENGNLKIKRLMSEPMFNMATQFLCATWEYAEDVIPEHLRTKAMAKLKTEHPPLSMETEFLLEASNRMGCSKR